MPSTERVRKGTFKVNEKYYPIYDGINLIGRNKEAGVNLINVGVSQHHAQFIIIDDDQHFIADLKSSNGTFLDGDFMNPYQIYRITSGSEIVIANFKGIYQKTNDQENNSDFSQTNNADLSQNLTQNFYLGETQVTFNEAPTQAFHFDDFKMPTRVSETKDNSEKKTEIKINGAPTQITTGDEDKPIQNVSKEFDINEAETEVVPVDNESTQIVPAEIDIVEEPRQITHVNDELNLNASTENDINESPTQIIHVNDELSSNASTEIDINEAPTQLTTVDNDELTQIVLTEIDINEAPTQVTIVDDEPNKNDLLEFDINKAPKTTIDDEQNDSREIDLSEQPTQIINTSEEIHQIAEVKRQSVSFNEELIQIIPINNENNKLPRDYYEATTQMIPSTADDENLETQLSAVQEAPQKKNVAFEQETQAETQPLNEMEIKHGHDYTKKKPKESDEYYEAATQFRPDETENNDTREHVEKPETDCAQNTSINYNPRVSVASTSRMNTTGEVIDETLLDESILSNLEKDFDESSNDSIDFFTMQKCRQPSTSSNASKNSNTKTSLPESNTVNKNKLARIGDSGSETDIENNDNGSDTEEIVRKRRKCVKPLLDSQEEAASNSDTDIEDEIERKRKRLKKPIVDSTQELQLEITKTQNDKKSDGDSGSETDEDLMQHSKRDSSPKSYLNGQGDSNKQSDMFNESDVIPATQEEFSKPQSQRQTDSNDSEESFRLGLTQMMNSEKSETFPSQKVTQNKTSQSMETYPNNLEATQNSSQGTTKKFTFKKKNLSESLIATSLQQIEQSKGLTENNEDDIYMAATQKSDGNDQVELNDDDVYMAATQKSTGSNKSTQEITDKENVYLAATQQFNNEPDVFVATQNDDFYVAQTQKFDAPNNPPKKTFNEYVTPTQKSKEVLSDKPEEVPDDYYEIATQKFDIPNKPIQSNKKLALKVSSSRVSLTTTDQDLKTPKITNDDVYEIATQKFDILNKPTQSNTNLALKVSASRVSLTTADQDFETPKITNNDVYMSETQQSDELRSTPKDDIYFAPTQKLEDTEKALPVPQKSQKLSQNKSNATLDKKTLNKTSEESKKVKIVTDNVDQNNDVYLEATQQSSASISPLKQSEVLPRSSVESQLEVMFATQTVHLIEDTNRPSNPLLCVLNEKETQDNSQTDENFKKPQASTSSKQNTSIKEKTTLKKEPTLISEHDKSDFVKEDLHTSYLANKTINISVETKSCKTRKSKATKTIVEDVVVSSRGRRSSKLVSSPDKKVPEVVTSKGGRKSKKVLAVSNKLPVEEAPSTATRSTKRDLVSKRLEVSSITEEPEALPLKKRRTRQSTQSSKPVALPKESSEECSSTEVQEIATRVRKRRTSSASTSSTISTASRSKRTRKSVVESDSDDEKEQPKLSRKLSNVFDEADAFENIPEKGTPKTKRQPRKKTADCVTNVMATPVKKSLRNAKSETKSDTSASASSMSSPEKSGRSQRKQRPKVVFTMMDSPQLECTIKRLGGTVVDTEEESTVLVTGAVKRSPKLLAAVSHGKPICSAEWLTASNKEHTFLDPWEYILVDHDAEKKWDFSLKESLKRSKESQLLAGYTFQILATNVFDVLKGSIEASGGKIVNRLPASTTDKFVIVSNAENKRKHNTLLKQNPELIIVEPEAIYDGVLRQELRLQRHVLR